MFKPNNEIQQSLFNKIEMMPDYLKKKLQKSWVQVFRDQIFPHINEERFAVLYSDKASRPNTPINMLIGLLIIKDMTNASDVELEESIHFDPRYQYALMSENLERQPISENSFTNFRRRLTDYENDTGIDLVKVETVALSEKFADILDINGRSLRIDSLMVSSSCKKMSRLELVYSVIHKYIKELYKLDESLVLKEYKVYLKDSHRKEVIYSIKNDALDSKLTILFKQAYELYQHGLTHAEVTELESFKLLERLLSEQVTITDDETILIKPGKEIKPNYLQSATDPDATYRNKYKDNVGYVANIVEAYDDSNEEYTKGIITNYDYRQNTHSDIEFIRDYVNEVIADNANEDEAPEQTTEMALDGAYFDQDLVNEASEHNINMSFTNLIGRKPDSDKLSISEFSIDQENNVIASCANGNTPEKSQFKEGTYTAHFNKKDCKSCPLFELCTIKEQKKSNVVRFSEKAYQTEQLRKEMSTKEYKAKSNKRAAIEGIPSILRRKYNVDHMPVLGYLRSKLAFGFKILAINARRLQKGLSYMR